MSKVNNITKALNAQKVELSSAKIEFTVTSDMKKLISTAFTELSTTNKLKAQALGVVNDAISANRQAGIIATNVISMGDNLKKQAKELGLDLPADALKMIGEAEDIVKNFKSSQQQLISAKGNL